MKTTSSLLVCIVAMLFAPTPISDGEYKLSDPELIESVAQYKSAVKEDREKMLPNFERVIKSVRMDNSIAAGERAKIIADLEQYRDEFVGVGTIPNNAILIRLANSYFRSIEKAERKLDLPFKKAVEYCIKKGNDEESAALLKYRNQLILGDGAKVIGHWQHMEHGFAVQFDIQNWFGQWSVARTFTTSDGSVAGTSAGRDISISNGVLSYTDYFVKKPRADWHDSARFTIQRDHENAGRLSARWEVGSGQSGSIGLVPAP